MIVGHGLMAKAFSGYQQNEKVLIFASGVSDSKFSAQDAFNRERDLLAHTIYENKTKKLVYFGTCSVNDPDLQNSIYVQHKMDMEKVIQLSGIEYSIFRLPNVAGFSGNPNTILNFLYSHIANKKPFDLWKNSERNVIDITDVFNTVDHVLKNDLFTNNIVNIANTNNYPVRYIISCIEHFCDEKAIYTEIEKGVKFSIDLADILPVYSLLNIEFGDGYLPHLLEKYYSKK